jgi:hypothetical protein
MNVEIGRQKIIILFWKLRGHAVSILGIHKSEPDIYIGFSTTLHLQCIAEGLWHLLTIVSLGTCALVLRVVTDSTCNVWQLPHWKLGSVSGFLVAWGASAVSVLAVSPLQRETASTWRSRPGRGLGWPGSPSQRARPNLGPEHILVYDDDG